MTSSRRSLSTRRPTRGCAASVFTADLIAAVRAVASESADSAPSALLRDSRARALSRLFAPRRWTRTGDALRDLLRPGVHVFRAMRLAAAIHFGIRRECFLDEAAHLFFIRGMFFHGFDDDAVDRAIGVLRDRAQSGAELRRRAESWSFLTWRHKRSTLHPQRQSTDRLMPSFQRSRAVKPPLLYIICRIAVWRRRSRKP